MGRIEDTFYIPSKKETEERVIKPSIPDTQGRSYCLCCGTMVAEQYRYCPQCRTKLKK